MSWEQSKSLAPRSSEVKINQKTREGLNCPKILAGRGFQQTFSNAAGKIFPDFLAAQDAIPVKAWALAGTENDCWKIGSAFAPGSTQYDWDFPEEILKNAGKTQETLSVASEKGTYNFFT